MFTHMLLVSCIMPTADRRRFVPLAIEYFLRQDYPERELIVVDDGSDAVEGLMPSDARVRHIHLDKERNVGAMWKLTGEPASGESIVHRDADDLMPDRPFLVSAPVGSEGTGIPVTGDHGWIS